jgi:hypothetical protein
MGFTFVGSRPSDCGMGGHPASVDAGGVFAVKAYEPAGDASDQHVGPSWYGAQPSKMRDGFMSGQP